MSQPTIQELLQKTAEYQQLATESLLATAKKKEKKKLDPKAKVRNRGTVCVPAESAKDKKDHFPINDEGQARNALARVHQYSSAPSWYKGSLKGLQALVSRKVHSKYPSIGKADKKKKSYVEVSSDLVHKYGQGLVSTAQTQIDRIRPALQAFMSLVSKYANQPAARVLIGQLSTLADQVEQGGSVARAALPKILPLMGQVRNALGREASADDPALLQHLMDFRGALMQHATQQAPQAKQDEAPDTGEYGTRAVEPQVMPAAHISAYPPIDKKFQSMLHASPDGQLGPKTRAALEAYKKSRNPGMSDELAFEYLKKEPEYASGKELPFDDNSNTFGRST